MVDFGVDLPVIHEIYTKYARIINVFARNFGKKRCRITTTAHYMRFIVVYITSVPLVYCVTANQF